MSVLSFMPDDLDVAEELREWLKPELMPGERLVWASRAGLSQMSRRRMLALPAGLFAASVVVGGSCMLALAMMSGGSPSSLLAGLFFIVAFLSMIMACSSGFALVLTAIKGHRESKQVNASSYALSDRRAILRLPSTMPKGVVVRSIPRGTVTNVTRIEYPDGTGDVEIRSTSYAIPLDILVGVHDPRLVAQLIRKFLIVDPAESLTK
jgi:ABC-type multidrug transport system fused ATPase/permease subunit